MKVQDVLSCWWVPSLLWGSRVTNASHLHHCFQPVYPHCRSRICVWNTNVCRRNTLQWPKLSSRVWTWTVFVLWFYAFQNLVILTSDMFPSNTPMVLWHTSKPWHFFLNPALHYTAWCIGILILAYYNHYVTGYDPYDSTLYIDRFIGILVVILYNPCLTGQYFIPYIN